MLGRVLIGFVGVGVGCVVGGYFGGHFRVANGAIPSPTQPQLDEAVVELRVRMPASGVTPGAESNQSSTFPYGAMVNTGNPLDLAIEGDGFIEVTLPDGTRGYVRGGSFGVAKDGQLVTADGHLVSNNIAIPQTAVAVSVGSDGTVSVQHAGATNVATQLGQLTLARFVNPGWLKKGTKGTFYETEGSGSPCISTPGLNGTGFIRQGYRERRAEHLAESLADLVRQIAEEEQRGGGVSGVTRTR